MNVKIGGMRCEMDVPCSGGTDRSVIDVKG